MEIFKRQEPKKRVYRRHYTERELNKVGVTILNRDNVHLQCKKCEQEWSPMLQSGGRLPRGYWKCPNGCNSEN